MPLPRLIISDSMDHNLTHYQHNDTLYVVPMNWLIGWLLSSSPER